MAAPASQTADRVQNRWLRWFSHRPKLTLLLLMLAALGPFIAKPFSADDPLFVWAARQIQAHPENPYGFNVNWYATVSPMWEVTQNPPLAGYYLAAAASVLDWSEPALHGALLLPALAAILGTWRLARRFCNRPMFAAMATLFTPVFLVSSTTVMCDTLMLAFWVWAVVLWVEGMDRFNLQRDKHRPPEPEKATTPSLSHRMGEGGRVPVADGYLWRLGAAGVLIALAALTKYFGACLVPLLAAYSFMESSELHSKLSSVDELAGCGACFQRAGSGGILAASAGQDAPATRRQDACATRTTKRHWIGSWAFFLLIPIGALAAYEWATHALYGKGLLLQAANYAGAARIFTVAGMANVLIALAFTGGCLAMATFLLPLLWRPRVWVVLAGSVVVIGVLLFTRSSMLKEYQNSTGTSPGWLGVQIVFWAIGGLSLIGLAVADAWSRRDAKSCLLAFWVLGTFVFAGFLNWIVNARSLLPIAPAVGILLARRLESRRDAPPRVRADRQRGPAVFLGKPALVCSVAGAALALLVARSDYILARAARQSAEATSMKFGGRARTLWFEGHWGFQLYMERLGRNARPAAAGSSKPVPGDFLAIPLNNTNIDPPDPRFWHPLESLKIGEPRWLTTGNSEVGAGFYASVYGPLPFAFGRVPSETVLVYCFGPIPPTPRLDSPR